MMRIKVQTGLWTVVTALVLSGAAVSAKTTTLTGKVGDAMCGAKHMMGGDDVACTKECVKKGSDYALIVQDKVYTLKTATAATKAELDKVAGQSAKITGDLNGDTIQVTSVQAAK